MCVYGMEMQITKGPSIEEAKKSCVWVRDYLELEEQESSDDQPNKPVDEDLYKIPPELLFSKPKKASLGFQTRLTSLSL